MIGASRASRVPMIRIFRHQAFMLLWTGQCISTLGDGLFRVALAWAVLVTTGSALAMGVVFLASLVPTLLLTLFGGVAADRLPRRLILLCSDTGRAVVVGLIAALAAWHALQFWHLLVLSLLFGVADSFFQPAYQSIIPQLVEEELLQPANSLVQSSAQASRMIGPVLGAVVVVATNGQSLAFGMDAVTFLFSAGCLAALRLPPGIPGTPQASQEPHDIPETVSGIRGMLTDIGEGLRYVSRQRWLWITILVAALGNVSYSVPFAAVLPKLVQNVYGAGAGVFGVLVAADAAGFLLASVVLGFIHLQRRGLVAYGAVAISCLALAVLGLPLPHGYEPVVAIGACVAAGFGIGVFTVLEISLVQELVPEHLLGRVMSVDMMGSFVLLPAGLIAIGWLADRIGPAPIFVIGGLLSLAVALGGLCVREIRELR
jgi:MFS family permease